MGARSFYVYILANRIGGTLHIGVINDLFGGCTSTNRVPLKASPSVTT